MTMEPGSCFILSLCRGSDPDRAPKYRKVLEKLGAKGAIADLNDGPEQSPLDPELIEETILDLLPADDYDLICTHSPLGEYTRHRRHEEIGRVVLSLWLEGRLRAGEIRLFAFDDSLKATLPLPVSSAPLHLTLPEEFWERKYDLITKIYGFPPDGFEARTTPRTEAFWQIRTPEEGRFWLEKERKE